MQCSRRYLPSFLALALLAASDRRADVAAFRPGDGSSLAKNFSFEFEAEVGDVTITVGGQDISGNVPDDFTVAFEAAMSVTDHYLKTGDGRPLELSRSYDSMAASWTGSGRDSEEVLEADAFDALADHRVRLKWNAETSEYEVAFEEAKGEPDLLEIVGDDMDLRAFLPSGEVSEGDSWTVDKERVGTALCFGSRFRAQDVSPEGPIVQMMIAEVLPQLPGLSSEWKLGCEYKGRRDSEGASLGMIALTLLGEGKVDLVSIVEEVAKQDIPEDLAPEVTVTTAVAELKLSEGKGELLWDLKAGHLRSFELSVDIEIQIRIEVAIEIQGETQEFEAEGEFTGGARWKAGL